MRQRRGDLDMVHWQRLIDAADTMRGLPLYIDDTPALSIAQIRQRARRFKRRHGLRLLVVDHLQLVGGDARSENRTQEVSAISRGLKAIAKELDVPVLALSQLTRRVEEREDKRPQLADLRESGSTEQDADVVMFIFREEYYLAKSEPHRKADESDDRFNDRYDHWRERCDRSKGIAEIIIAKQREGPLSVVRAHWNGELMRFSNLARDGEDY